MVKTKQQILPTPGRATRFLVLTFCLAPVLVPLVAIVAVLMERHSVSANLSLASALSSSAQAAAPDVQPRDPFTSAVFAEPALAPPVVVTSGETILPQTPTVAGTHVLRQAMERASAPLAAGQFSGLPEAPVVRMARDRLDIVVPLQDMELYDLVLRPSRIE